MKFANLSILDRPSRGGLSLFGKPEMDLARIAGDNRGFVKLSQHAKAWGRKVPTSARPEIRSSMNWFDLLKLCKRSIGDSVSQPWFYPRLEAYSFVGLCEGA
jgi:hypothetical protein